MSPIVLSPRTCTFGCFTDQEWVNAMSPPKGIEKWSWVSYAELEASCAQIMLDAGSVGSHDEAIVRYNLIGLMDLNRDHGSGDPDFAWFIAYDVGFFFRKRSAHCCPWKDPSLYVPTRWAIRVLRAVEMGICSVKWTTHNNLKPTYRADFKGDKKEDVSELVR